MTTPVEQQAHSQLTEAVTRLRSKEMYRHANDSLSLRVPGMSDFLLLNGDSEECRRQSVDSDSIHAFVYRNRPDAGAVLLGATEASQQLGEMSATPPILFDEQARHIGRTGQVASADDLDCLKTSLRRGSIAAIIGEQCLRIGTTAQRLVFNAELFEKCATAFLIAGSCGRPLRTIPAWVCWIAGRRLQKDKRSAARAFAAGEFPQDTNAY